MSLFRYDTAYAPALPVLPIAVSAPGSDGWVQLTGVADTGADVTVVPQPVAEAVLAAIGTVRVVGPGGDLHSAPLYRAAVHIDGRTDLIEVVGLGVEVIVGRDLLNRWVARFDGPRGTLQLTN